MVSDLFERLGRELGIRALIDTFYDFMNELPEAVAIRKLHPDDLSESREKLYEFLTGWSGGPPLYTEKYGHPRLRMRHMPFPIGVAERDQWLLCMEKAFEKCQVDPEVQDFLRERFFQIADFMRNKEEPAVNG
ncbi:MAG: group II truncated hemoglobin [Bdellovibrionales bacterium]|nr:group II truncated hemoglobin [Bdellovibrionales bacterium]